MNKKFFVNPEAIPFIIFNIFITFIFILLLFSVCDSVHAASDEQLTFDGVYPIDQNDGNLKFSQAMIDKIWSDFDSENNYIFAFYSDQSGGLNNVYISYTPKSLGGCFYAEVQTDVTRFRLYTIGSTNWNSRLVRFDPSNVNSYQNININNNVFLNLGAYDYSYISNFTLLTNNTDTGKVVLRLYHRHDPKPPREETVNYNSSDSEPNEVPYNPNVSTDTNFLGKTLQYFGSLINNQFNNFQINLYDNLYPLIKFFTDIYNFGLDDEGNFSLLNAISNIFTFLFIPDPVDLSNLLASHDIYGVIGLVEETQLSVNHVHSMITGGENIYKLTIRPFVLAGKILGPYDIDFSWYLDFKDVGDPMISAFLIFGYFMWLHTRLPYWLRGQQGDITLMTKEVTK